MELADKFSSLYQGGMSMADCYARFIMLTRFAPHCDIPDVAARAHRFQRDLRVKYKPFVASHEKDVLEDIHEVRPRLEKEAGDARRRTVFKIRREVDDHPRKRQHQQQYHQPAATVPPLFVALP